MSSRINRRQSCNFRIIYRHPSPYFSPDLWKFHLASTFPGVEAVRGIGPKQLYYKMVGSGRHGPHSQREGEACKAAEKARLAKLFRNAFIHIQVGGGRQKIEDEEGEDTWMTGLVMDRHEKVMVGRWAVRSFFITMGG